MDQLRSEIWDLVYRSSPQTIAQLAESLQISQETIGLVVDHEWFSMQGDAVAIATRDGTPAAPSDEV